MGTALEIGRIVIDEIYGGDIEEWRASGKNDSSFRQLGRSLENRGRGVSAMTIYRACGLLELEDRLGVSALLGLSATHGVAVLGLPGPVQKELLQRAKDKGLTSRQLQAAAAEKRPKRLSGRKAKPRFVKSLGRVRKMLDEDGFGELAAAEDMDVDRARSLLETVSDLRERLDTITATLEERIDGG